jgi:hypothetical protein
VSFGQSLAKNASLSKKSAVAKHARLKKAGIKARRAKKSPAVAASKSPSSDAAIRQTQEANNPVTKINDEVSTVAKPHPSKAKGVITTSFHRDESAL